MRRNTPVRWLAGLSLVATIGCGAHAAPQATPTGPSSSKEAQAALRDLQSQLETVSRAPVMAHGAWGVHVRWLNHGDVLFALNAGKLMMPGLVP